MNKRVIGLALVGSLVLGSISQGQNQDKTKEQLQIAEKQLEAAALAIAGAAAEAAKAKAAVKKKPVVAVRRVPNYRFPVAQYRKNVDRNDPTERILLLTRQGPIVLEVAIFMDGKPFRSAREKIVDAMMKNADLDKNGKVKWTEAVRTPRFHFGRIPTALLAQNRYMTSMMKSFDLNKNGIVERNEAVRFLTTYFQDSFSVTGGAGGMSQYYSYSNSSSRPAPTNVLQKVLDADKDGVVSAKELADAVARIKKRDANDDDVIDANELGGTVIGNLYSNALRIPRTRGSSNMPIVTSLRLGVGMTARQLHGYLVAKYAQKTRQITKKVFSDGELFAELDKNKDGKLSGKELTGLNKARPHVKMEYRLTKAGKNSKLALIRHNKQVIESVTTGSSSVAIEMGLTTVKFTVNRSPVRRMYDYSSTAKQLLVRYDKNKNNYIDKKKAPRGQFDRWDLNGDGKVYAKEIKESYTLTQLPSMTQFRASVVLGRDPMFATADKNKDNRLSARELVNIVKSLSSFDANNDGKITKAEVPSTITVTMGSGVTVGRYGGFAQARRRLPRGRIARKGKPAAPRWFTAMDRNSDGDLTLREFLGNEKQFKKLDTNKDGFIDVKEATGD